ncbi:uncharacterized protein LAESUDRAFT_509228 [Laetiporus sulphureus 93-53]|uniref:Uncharacterized protein n=1 Tax=Laetiporus sulphureus 93-53 TaxID=1314785 RepID=A0A165FXC1_9APHY|nr:uncharacterized protein LAESUDRAFT_509228 [Laetiporus sulphureus 93-53]KZT09538.1 hypothetical protein LAESUDRAFT_509228 [Laetiporus sulphureus 93-53]
MSSEDSCRATETLRLLAETCSIAVETLQQPPSTISSPAATPACSVLHKDFLSLLTLVYTSTTKVALAFRPQEPAYKAALAPLRDLAGNVTALTSCATLFDAHGATLAEEARMVVKGVLEAVSAFASGFLDGSDYLVRTGAVHDLVDKAKRGFPTDNRAAIRSRWISDRGMLEDSLAEVMSMIEDNEDMDRDGDEDEEFDNDEWDELGLGSSKKMSEVELDHVKKIQPLLRFTTLLHKRVQIDVLSNIPMATSPNCLAPLDALPAHSHALLVASEEVIASLYAPPDPSSIASAISPLAESVRDLHATLLGGELLPPRRADDQDVDALTRDVASMTVGAGGASRSAKQERDVRKWFDTCFKQIEILSASIGDTLALEVMNAR